MLKRAATALAFSSTLLGLAVKAEDNRFYRLLGETPWVNLKQAPQPQDLEGRVLLLDFWTFCCINCMHVLPDLHRLEQEFGDKLVVLGIHSAKFENEKDSEQIVQAIEKYGIHHPVANDSAFRLWQALRVSAWPTFALFSAQGRLVTMEGGEGVYEKFRGPIQELITEAEKSRQLKRNTLKPIAAQGDTLLRFPGKILLSGTGFFVSDSEHHQIREFSREGKERRRFGSGVQGLKDGSGSEAQFHSPQGLALSPDKKFLYVADTENHALREIDLSHDQVRTLLGDGKQAKLRYWEEPLKNELSSPWDLSFFEGKLILAMAGTHQLYSFDPRTRKLELFAGSGREDLADASPLKKAAFAQTSGLSAQGSKLFLVDSETSSLRVIEKKEVKTLVGQGLFEFGLRNGARAEARLQHPLGVVAAKDAVYVADTYNHALRRFDLKSGKLETLFGGQAGFKDGSYAVARVREPNGLALDGDTLFVADTNNHQIRLVDLKKHEVRTLKLSARADTKPSFLPNLRIEAKLAPAPDFRLRWELPPGMKVNAKAPSRLTIKGGPTLDLRQEMSHEIKVPAGAAGLEGTLYYCQSDGSGSCLIESIRLSFGPGTKDHEFVWRPEKK